MNIRRFCHQMIQVLAVFFCLIGSSSGQKHYKELVFGPVKDVTVPQPHQARLQNGIQVLLLEDHEWPFINMRGIFAAGSVWEPPEKAGLADLCGVVMRSGGSQVMHGDRIDEELEKIAASVETYIGVTEGGASLSALKEHFDRVLAIYADVLMRPAFPPGKIELAKINAKSAIARRNDYIATIAAQEFSRLIYGPSSPYARYSEYATIDAISRDDLIAFHKKFVRPDHMILAVWGDFTTTDMLKKIRKTFEPWPATGEPRPAIPEVDYSYRYTVNLIKKPEATQSYIYLGHIGGKKDNPDLPALTLMNEIFGGSFSSRLFNRLRAAEGLSYRVEGMWGSNYAFAGKFHMMVETQSSRTVEAIRSMLREMKLLTSELVSEEELHQARDSWINSYVFDFDDNEKVMERWLTLSFYGYSQDFLQQLRARLEKATREDILRVAQKYLHPEEVQILVVGNPAAFDQPLSTLGEVREIDITIPATKAEKPAATTENIKEAHLLLQKMAASLGGSETVSAIKTLHTQLQSVQLTPMGEMTSQSQAIVVYPDRACTILKTPMGEVRLILNGDRARMISPQGSMPAPETLKNNLKASLFRDTIGLARTLTEIDAQLVGKTEFAHIPAWELIISKGERSFHLFLDQTDFMPIGKKYTSIGPQGETETEERYQDYREVAGLKIPFTTLVFEKDKKIAEKRIMDWKVNEVVDENLFEME